MVSFFDDFAELNNGLRAVIKPYSAVFLLCDENTSSYCFPHLMDSLAHASIIQIASGEQHKSLQTTASIWQMLTDRMADRKSLLINLGGGVICDMGGFAASCYKRGIDFINIPTTLLAMADASVGGKTGIDFNNYKNQIGLFAEAKQTLICPAFLDTLDARQVKSGMAEIIKHYLIEDKKAFMDFAAHRDGSDPIDIALIKKAVEIKSGIVASDPFEKNVRKKLNFGHTIGHALESHYMDSLTPLLHGEAIAIGMAIEVQIADLLGILHKNESKVIFDFLLGYFDLGKLPESIFDSIIGLILQDKKNHQGIIKMALLIDIGNCQIDIEVGEKTIQRAIESYNKKVDR